MYRLVIETIFSILFVYPEEFLTPREAEEWKLGKPHMDSFNVMSDKSIGEWTEPVIYIPVKSKPGEKS